MTGMPELPDITVYLEALERRVLNQTLKSLQLSSPFLLRTATPPIASVHDKRVVRLQRLGKRICLGMETDLWIVLHLMIAGRLHWKELPTGEPAARAIASVGKSKNQLAVFRFDTGLLSMTEAGTQRRASMHIIDSAANLKTLDAGGVELFIKKSGRNRGNTGFGQFIDLSSFTRILKSENHTLKRALTDPRLFSGIGNAYSDEILWQAQLSPVKLTQKMNDEEINRLHEATRHNPRGLGGTFAPGSRRSVSRKGNCLSRWNGGARTLQRSVSALRLEDSAHSIRHKRNELLSDLSDRWKTARGSRIVAYLARGLAKNC